MNIKNYLGILFFFIIVNKVESAVDYSSFAKKNRPISSAKINATGKKSTKSFNNFFELNSSYEGHSIKDYNDGKLSIFKVSGLFRPFDEVFASFSYWEGQTTITDLTNEKYGDRFQKGNLAVKLGLNWFNSGNEIYKTKIDLLFGAVFAQNNSPVALSRTDKTVGFESTKRFDYILVGIGADLILTGTPKSENELIIGNIAKFTAALGWIVSEDIRLSIEASSIKIYASKEKKRDFKLDDDVSFSTLSPFLYLSLGATTLEAFLGLHINTKKIKSNQNILMAKLYNFPGAYGNCILAGLTFTL